MFVKPESIVLALHLSGNEKVADLGCGSGAYSLAIAPLVSGGTVYAVDVQQDMLSRLKSEAEKKGIKNIEYIWGDIEKRGGTKIADSVIDVAILSNTLFQISNKNECVAEIARILKNKGKVLIIDWTDSFSGMGPHKDAVVNKESARTLFEGKGFIFKQSVDAGEHHYGIILTYEK